MVDSPRGTTMPRPIPVPVRQAIHRLWQQGQQTGQIAASLGLPSSTVRRLLGRFRSRGAEAIAPDYRRPPVVAVPLPDATETALRLRRQHPTWGAGVIRVQLVQGMPGQLVPSVRTLQRRFAGAGLTQAKAGGRPRVHLARATVPHETWQMDAKEHIKLIDNSEASWLRLIDECSGTVLWTAVFPPRYLEPRPRRVRARATSSGLRPLGTAGGASGSTTVRPGARRATSPPTCRSG